MTSRYACDGCGNFHYPAEGGAVTLCHACWKQQRNEADAMRKKLSAIESELRRLWYDVRDPIAEGTREGLDDLEVFAMYDDALSKILKEQ